MSDSDSDSGPEVIRFTGTATTPVVTKKERKSYMSSTAPKEIGEATPARRKKNIAEDEEDLQKDQELQRLLDESHILSEANQYSGADISNIDLDPIGKSRVKTIDRRLDLLGLKAKKGGQVPMNMVQGIKKAQKTRLQREIKDAAEAGIVLAKSKRVEKKKAGKRQRGLQINSIGKNTRHGLVLSEREIKRVSSRKK